MKRNVLATYKRFLNWYSDGILRNINITIIFEEHTNFTKDELDTDLQMNISGFSRATSNASSTISFNLQLQVLNIVSCLLCAFTENVNVILTPRQFLLVKNKRRSQSCRSCRYIRIKLCGTKQFT